MDEKIREVGDTCKVNENGYIIPICVDFDATLTDANLYPHIANENPHAFDIMKEWTKKYNVGWVLDTMRGGKDREAAIAFCKERGIEFYAVGRTKEQKTWTDSTKAYGIFSIDDRNVGVPLKHNKEGYASVDWLKIKELLEPTLERIKKYHDKR